MKRWAGWTISWNQEFQEKYQQPQICRSYYSNYRKWSQEVKWLLRRLKEESEKAGLKLNIKKLRSGYPVPSLYGKQKGKKQKQWQIFFSWVPKITADSAWSHEIKRYLLLGKKTMINLDTILKSRDITLLAKVWIAKAMIFLVVMYDCERWTIKKAEWKRIDAFELWCWRRLESPLDSKKIKPVNTKEINPEYSMEGLMLKVKFQNFGQLMRRANSLEETLRLGKTGGKMRRGQQLVR